MCPKDVDVMTKVKTLIRLPIKVQSDQGLHYSLRSICPFNTAILIDNEHKKVL